MILDDDLAIDEVAARATELVKRRDIEAAKRLVHESSMAIMTSDAPENEKRSAIARLRDALLSRARALNGGPHA